MPRIQKSAILPYNAQQLYDLVNDVSRYPEFLPWCSASEIESEDASHMRASLTIGHRGLSRQFTTSNQLAPGQRITMHLVEGPFQYLEGVWTFEDREDAHCLVTFVLDFEFKKSKNALLFGPLFKKAAGDMVHAFRQRAEAVYGD